MHTLQLDTPPLFVVALASMADFILMSGMVLWYSQIPRETHCEFHGLYAFPKFLVWMIIQLPIPISPVQ